MSIEWTPERLAAKERFLAADAEFKAARKELDTWKGPGLSPPGNRFNQASWAFYDAQCGLKAVGLRHASMDDVYEDDPIDYTPALPPSARRGI